MLNRTESNLLFKRANVVIPTGIYGHVAPGAGLPQDFLIIVCLVKVAILQTLMGIHGWILCVVSEPSFMDTEIPLSRRR